MTELPQTSLDYAALYSEIHGHANGKYYAGKVRGLDAVVALVKKCRPRNLLDYGCGKGYQYLAARSHEVWGGLLPHCYDIGVRHLAKRPEGAFDGVICCDVMEHIEECDIGAVLDDIFGLVSTRVGRSPPSFAYFHIACIPANARALPDGRNVHLTVRPPEWWNERLNAYARAKLIIEARYDCGHGVFDVH